MKRYVVTYAEEFDPLEELRVIIRAYDAEDAEERFYASWPESGWVVVSVRQAKS